MAVYDELCYWTERYLKKKTSNSQQDSEFMLLWIWKNSPCVRACVRACPRLSNVSRDL